MSSLSQAIRSPACKRASLLQSYHSVLLRGSWMCSRSSLELTEKDYTHKQSHDVAKVPLNIKTNTFLVSNLERSGTYQDSLMVNVLQDLPIIIFILLNKLTSLKLNRLSQRIILVVMERLSSFPPPTPECLGILGLRMLENRSNLHKLMHYLQFFY